MNNMETIKAPKRSRKERGCISRTFRSMELTANIYDRDKKKEVSRPYTFTGSAADLTTEKIMKMIRADVAANFQNELFLDFIVIKSADVRYYMTEADFIKYASKAE